MVTQGYNVLSQIVMKRDNIGTVLNFDLCDLQKVGKIKNTGSCHVSLLGVPMIKILSCHSSGAIPLCWFSNMAAWRPYLKSDRVKIR
jgi:hypothetical protein